MCEYIAGEGLDTGGVRHILNCMYFVFQEIESTPANQMAYDDVLTRIYWYDLVKEQIPRHIWRHFYPGKPNSKGPWDFFEIKISYRTALKHDSVIQFSIDETSITVSS